MKIILMEQKIGYSDAEYTFLKMWLENYKNASILLVCGKSFDHLHLSKVLEKYAIQNNIKIVRFSDFTPNPDYSSVEQGVNCFKQHKCQAIIAVGGGSAMDVAKCIKLYHNMKTDQCFLEQDINPNQIELFVVPTTAGTGSEATKYAVIYDKGVKQSVTHESCIPGFVLFDPEVLKTLNDYHRRASMLDALCHAIESFWSVHSTVESIQYSSEAISLIYQNMDVYLANDFDGNKNMMYASYLAGKAINITATTAGHAMCYKFTSTYGIAHGFAAAICTKHLWFYMLEHSDNCVDHRGRAHLEHMFQKIAEASECQTSTEAAWKFSAVVDKLFEKVALHMEDIPSFTESVNLVRLKNNPILLTECDIQKIYTNIFKQEGNCCES